MEQNDKLKEMRMALNARMLLLFVGIMMVVNGLTSTGRNGLSWLNLAGMVAETQVGTDTKNAAEKQTDVEAVTEKLTETEAATEKQTEAVAGKPIEAATEEPTEASTETETELDIEALAAQMEEAGITVNDLKILGVIYLIMAVIETVVGLICALFSNRVDKSRITLRAVIVLLVAEVLSLIVLAFKGALMLNILINSLLLPLVLLWCALRLRKLAKADPERVYAVKQNRQSAKPAAPAAPAPKKSLKERALINAPEESEEPEEIEEPDEPEQAKQAEETEEDLPEEQ